MTGYISRLRAQAEALRRAERDNRIALLLLAALRTQRRITRPGRAHAEEYLRMTRIAEELLRMLPRDAPGDIARRSADLVHEVDRPAAARAKERRRG